MSEGMNELTMIINQMDRMNAKQDTLMVDVAQIKVNQDHVVHTISKINQTVDEHSHVLARQEVILENQAKELAKLTEAHNSPDPSLLTKLKDFAVGSPIFAIIMFVMIVNIVLTSVGAPIIDVSALYGKIK